MSPLVRLLLGAVLGLLALPAAATRVPAVWCVNGNDNTFANACQHGPAANTALGAAGKALSDLVAAQQAAFPGKNYRATGPVTLGAGTWAQLAWSAPGVYTNVEPGYPNVDVSYPWAGHVFAFCYDGSMPQGVAGEPQQATCPAPVCEPGTIVSEGYYGIGTKASGSPAMLACLRGCEAVFDGISPAGSTMEQGVRQYYAEGRYYRTGVGCIPGDAGGDLPDVGEGGEEVPPITCGANQAQGSVNGIAVCVDQQGNEQGSAGQPSGGTKTSREKVTNPDGSTTETTTETTSENNGRGGVTTTRRTTTENCTASGDCTTETEWVGGSVGGEDGEDPEDPVDACEANPERVGCKELGTVTGEPLTALTRPLSITPSGGFDHPDECPADKVLNLAHVTLTVPFSLLCQAADMARPIVIGVAWLSAILGFVGLARKG